MSNPQNSNTDVKPLKLNHFLMAMRIIFIANNKRFKCVNSYFLYSINGSCVMFCRLQRLKFNLKLNIRFFSRMMIQ